MPVSYSRTAFRSFLRLGKASRGKVRDAVETADDTKVADRVLPGGSVSRALDNGMRVIFNRAGDDIVVLAIQPTGQR